MRAARAAAALALLALPASAQTDPGRPAYRAVERLSDRVYGLLRGPLMTTLLPRRLSSRMGATPQTDSYAAFRGELSRKGDRAVRRIADSRPSGATTSPAATAEWGRRSVGEGEDALLDAFASTMVDRYQLEAFGQDSGAYARDRRNWEPRFLLSASVLGGAYLWAAGVDADRDLGPVKVGLKLAPGRRWRAAADGGASRLAVVEVSRGELRAYADWGSDGPRAERFGASWQRRF